MSLAESKHLSRSQNERVRQDVCPGVRRYSRRRFLAVCRVYRVGARRHGVFVLSQRKAIRTALLAGKKISGLTALREFGVMRLASRIQEIRIGAAGEKSLAVSDTWRIQKGKRFKVYYVPDAVSARYKAVLLANSMTGAKPPGRPRGTRKA